MRVVSGAVGKEKVHFEAPKADRLAREMTAFRKWFEAKAAIDPVLKAGLAHLWFVTIHPFEDGNGRIARAIADMALARSEHSSQRFYSMSAQIKQEHKEYYDVLESAQTGILDVTAWMLWFLDCLGRSIDGAHVTLKAVLDKARFWDRIKDVPLNDRQRSVINRLLDGFEGKLTSSKYAKLTKCSQDTAYRDIQVLVERHVLDQNPEGGAKHELLARALAIITRLKQPCRSNPP
jgi:Fic family protein